MLYYLYGPGKKDEHRSPHLVAAWDDAIIPTRDPALSESATLPALARLLEAPVEFMDGQPMSHHVYHVPVRLDPGDRELSDAEWNMVAREILDAVNVAPKGETERTCRWIAVRHADDHIHIVATLATEDGRKPELWKDKRAMQQRARELETRMGLRELRSGDKTAKKWPTQPELEKALRHGREESPRTVLHTRVRHAASAASSEADFFARLTRSGIRVQQRTAPDGKITGYSVALPGDRAATGRAVWFSGSKLAPDLSLPRVRERWQHGTGGTPLQPATRAEAWQQAAQRIEQATAALATAGDPEGAGIAAALGDVLTTWATEAPRLVRDELQDAARAFERAGRAPAAERATSEARHLLREATQCLAVGAMVAGGGGRAGGRGRSRQRSRIGRTRGPPMAPGEAIPDAGRGGPARGPSSAGRE
ncbi:LLM class flavin-dependent oxidoreductase [Streptomyces sp. GKU 257-1]|nr:LLM class flavin-dependent oxidoreductase [Streptomyces sp. GKU 257-1]